MNQLNNEQIANQASEAPQLCDSCFEFFGNKHTNNLCSGCFKKKSKEDTVVLKKNLETVADNAADKTEPNTPSVSHKASIDEESLTAEVKPVEVVEEKPKPVEKESNKCNKCSKKVSILGFQCKCGSTFCKSHRLPEDHDCDYDFKKAGVAKLTKDNPVVVASKIQMI